MTDRSDPTELDAVTSAPEPAAVAHLPETPEPDARPPRPSRAEVVAKIAAATAPKEFRLTFTGDGTTTALVRRVSLTNQAQLAVLPRAMQERVFHQVRDAEADAVSLSARIQNFDGYLRRLAKSQEVAQVLAMAGFVEPELVPTEADLDPVKAEAGLQWVVTDVAPEDLMAYVIWCQGDERAAAGRFRPTAGR